MRDTELSHRVDHFVRSWRVAVTETRETESSVLVFGTRGREAVVLKIARRQGDEWRTGEVLAAFGGRGAVRVHEYVGGAMLLERATPGTSLAGTAIAGRDDDATAVVADALLLLSGRLPPPGCSTIGDWGNAFERHLAGGTEALPGELVAAARSVHARLASTQRQTQLLHGDLQHYNLVQDAARGWLAIDPKGVVGEAEYEAGALLRNPMERPDVFLSMRTIERRIDVLTRRTGLDADRVLAWAFAQAVLSAIWSVEDGGSLAAVGPAVTLAMLMRRMMPNTWVE